MSDDHLVQVIRKSNDLLKREVLPNGMVLLVKEDHSAPVASVQIWIGTGAIHEQENLGGGLSHYVEHMIFKGTEKRTVGKITSDITDAGGRINAYTSKDRTVIYTDIPSDHWRTGVDVLGDAVMNSTFPEDEWEREAQVILNEFNMGKDDPSRVMQKLAYSTAYLVHPYRVPIIGYEDIFTKMTRDELMTFFDEHYTPDNMITVVVGDFDADEVLATLRKTFEKFERRAKEPVVLPAEPPQMAKRFQREEGSYNVTRARIMYHTVALSHEDAPALDVLAAIMGYGRSSRLNRKIKESMRLVHSISAWSYTPKYPGQFMVSATMDPDKETEVLAVVENEIAGWASAQFEDAELAKARRMVISGELADLQTANGQASSYASGEFYVGDPRFSEVYIEQINAVTRDDLARVAKKYFSPRNCSVAILSPPVEKAEAEDDSAQVIASPLSMETLDNGIRLIVREDHKLPFVYASLTLGGGLLSETAENQGVTRLTADMLVRGTGKRSSDEISDFVESHGGSIKPFSGRNSFGIQMRCLSDDTDAFMALLADCVLNPEFPTDALDLQRSVQLAAIKQDREQPFSNASESMREALFPGHPYRFNPLGTPDTVNDLSRKDLVKYMKKHMVGGNAVLTVFGDITPKAARKLVEKTFAKVSTEPAPADAMTPPQPALPKEIERTVPKEQVIYLVGFPGVSITDQKKYDALSILQTAMSGLSSKLSNEVREKRGLVYYSGAFQMAGFHAGMYAMYAGTREDALEELSGLFDQEIKRVREKGLEQSEFDAARNRIVAEHHMSLQDNLGLSQMTGLNELYGLGYKHAFSLKKRLDALTIEDVKAVAAEVLLDDKKVVVKVLPEKD